MKRRRRRNQLAGAGVASSFWLQVAASVIGSLIVGVALVAAGNRKAFVP